MFILTPLLSSQNIFLLKVRWDFWSKCWEGTWRRQRSTTENMVIVEERKERERRRRKPEAGRVHWPVLHLMTQWDWFRLGRTNFPPCVCFVVHHNGWLVEIRWATGNGQRPEPGQHPWSFSSEWFPLRYFSSSSVHHRSCCHFFPHYISTHPYPAPYFLAPLPSTTAFSHYGH